MRKSAFGLMSVIAPAILGGFTTTACGEDPLGGVGGAFEELCGPCGLVAEGDVGISGNAKIDGFFSAVSSLNEAMVSVNGNFEASINELIAVWGADVEATASLEAKITALRAEIDTQISANVMGGLTVNYVPPRCEANVSVAVEAQAQCEAKAECNVMATPGEVSVSCEGTCEGSCEGTCSGGFQCDLSAGGMCEGECSGSCELEAAATCEGNCRGTCSGTCEARDSMGNCAGKCEGMCTGTCELAASATCSGTCTGSCKVEAEADCDVMEPKCSGSCSGECSGSCKGKATPPQLDADCEASADCQAQASAQASAKLECTPPSLDIAFRLNASLDATARASFSAKMASLKVQGVAIVQGFGRLTALIDGEIDGQVVIDPAPLAQIRTSVQGLAEASVEGDLFAGIPVGRVNCAIEGFIAAGTMLGSIGSDATASLSAQASFVTSLTTGDFS
jgi:hypothetical protein